MALKHERCPRNSTSPILSNFLFSLDLSLCSGPLKRLPAPAAKITARVVSGGVGVPANSSEDTEDSMDSSSDSITVGQSGV